MTNPIHPLGELTLNGKTYQLRFDHYNLCLAEYRLEQQGYRFALMPDGPDGGEFVAKLLKATKVPDEDSLLKAAGVPGEDCKIKMKTEMRGVDQFRIGVLLYAGIIHALPAQTRLPDVQQWITLDNWIAVNQSVLTGYMAAIKRIGRDVGFDFGDEKPVEPESPLAEKTDGISAGPSVPSTSDSPTVVSGDSLPPSSTSSTDAA